MVTIFALGTGFVEAGINAIGLLAAKAVEKAVLRGVKSASSMLVYKAFNDIQKH